jgi:hypothetical protein
MNLKRQLLAISILVISTLSVYAYSNTFEDFDTSLVQGIEYSYQEPSKILFVQIDGNYENIALSTEQYVDLIYYYSITKLKLGNIPFHYAIDESGNVYQTQPYDEMRVTDDPYIVVGYLSNNGQLSNKAANAILDLSNELSHKYGVQEYDNYKFSITESENSFSKLTLVSPDSLFADSIDQIFTEWEPAEREHREYLASVVSVENEGTVEIGNRLQVKVTIKNENDFVWTSNRDPIYLSVKDSEESIFAVNEIWDSFSRATTVDSATFVLPGETVELQFALEPKVIPGEYSETFELFKFEGEPFSGSEFTVDFKVEKGEGRVVRITSPEFGFVNIRNCRRFSCDKIHVVNDGEVYPVVEYHESCWYKIEYGENQEGWFYCPYAEEIE